MNDFVNIDGGHYKNVSFFFQIILFLSFMSGGNNEN